MNDGGMLGTIVNVIIGLCCCILVIAAVGGGIFYFVRGRKPKDGGDTSAVAMLATLAPSPTSAPTPASTGGGMMNQALAGVGMPQVPGAVCAG